MKHIYNNRQVRKNNYQCITIKKDKSSSGWQLRVKENRTVAALLKKEKG